MSITVKKDGRTILKGKHYSEFRYEMWERSLGKCERCGRLVAFVPSGMDCDMHLHHKNGRGMGGGKRDDVADKCETLCRKCHHKEHGQ